MPGCTIEARDFDYAIDKYQALGATVIGVSHGVIEKLNRFSVSECRSRFPVAAGPDQNIMKTCDAILAAKPGYADRTFQVIAPSGGIIHACTDLHPDMRVER